MLSGKLIHLIEAHSDQITSRVIHQIRHDPQLKHIPGLPDAELRETGAHILENLGHWLASPKEEELDRRIGRFFDVLLVHLVHGYERALRRAAHVGAEPGAGGRR